MKKYITLIAIISFAFLLYPKISEKTEEYVVEQKNEKIIEEIQQDSSPKSHILDAQFICQAPLQTPKNWELHEESCEEAAFLQAYNYQTGQNMTKEEANQEILNMIAWQNINFNGHFDLYAEQMKEFISGYQNISPEQIRIISSPTVADMEKEIYSGKVVIAGVTAEILENKFYNYPGYHMLAIIGYDEENFITNDNGTKRGEKYIYSKQTLLNALQDAENKIIVLDI